MKENERTRLEELKEMVWNCPEGCIISLLGLPILEEFLGLLVKEEKSV